MIEISVSHFKKTCLSIFKQIKQTHEQVIITKFGKPVAKVIPIEEDNAYYNPLRGSVLFEEDLISPIDEKWDAES